MPKTVADLIAETLAEAGVERIWGVTGDSLNGLNDSLRRMGRIDWMSVRHEETAAFAAGAEAAVTGKLAVCRPALWAAARMRTSGPIRIGSMRPLRAASTAPDSDSTSTG